MNGDQTDQSNVMFTVQMTVAEIVAPSARIDRCCAADTGPEPASTKNQAAVSGLTGAFSTRAESTRRPITFSVFPHASLGSPMTNIATRPGQPPAPAWLRRDPTPGNTAHVHCPGIFTHNQLHPGNRR